MQELLRYNDSGTSRRREAPRCFWFVPVAAAIQVLNADFIYIDLELMITSRLVA